MPIISIDTITMPIPLSIDCQKIEIKVDEIQENVNIAKRGTLTGSPNRQMPFSNAAIAVERNRADINPLSMCRSDRLTSITPLVLSVSHPIDTNKKIIP